MIFVGTEMPDVLSVTSLYSIHRPDLLKSWPNKCGDWHPFPELFYLSHGKHWLKIDGKQYQLCAGQIILYAPYSYHEGADRVPQEPRAGILSFEVSSDLLAPLYNRVITLEPGQRQALEKILDEGVGCFHLRAPGDRVKGMVVNTGVEKLTLWRLRKQIEFLLMDLYSTQQRAQSQDARSRRWDRELSGAVAFLKEHLTEKLSLEDLARGTGMSVSKLKVLFRERTGGGPIQYRIQLQIERAKRLIREGELDLTGIAQQTGFSSLHYFSRSFKKITGVSPSEYKRIG